MSSGGELNKKGKEQVSKVEIKRKLYALPGGRTNRTSKKLITLDDISLAHLFSLFLKFAVRLEASRTKSKGQPTDKPIPPNDGKLVDFFEVVFAKNMLQMIVMMKTWTTTMRMTGSFPRRRKSPRSQSMTPALTSCSNYGLSRDSTCSSTFLLSAKERTQLM